MIKDISQLFQIGKDLGLNKKEIKNELLVKYAKLAAIITILFVVALIVIGIMRGNYDHTIYASGTYYSTVKKKDFRQRKRIYLRILRRN